MNQLVYKMSENGSFSEYKVMSPNDQQSKTQRYTIYNKTKQENVERDSGGSGAKKKMYAPAYP